MNIITQAKHSSSRHLFSRASRKLSSLQCSSSFNGSDGHVASPTPVFSNVVRSYTFCSSPGSPSGTFALYHPAGYHGHSLWNDSHARNLSTAPRVSSSDTDTAIASSAVADVNFMGTTSKEEVLEAEAASKAASIIRRIKADLVAADVNNDGKVDSEELKEILKRYSDVFTDKEIVEIGELFYVGKAGSGVPHEEFLKAVSNVADLDEGGVAHRRISGSKHPLGLGKCGTEFMFGKVRGVYTPEELDIKMTHVEPKTTSDKLALKAVHVVRFCFDQVSGWNRGEITQAKVLRRTIFLETVAAIPGFVAALARHFKSLRTFSRDGGMLNMFLDEANNERMHLLSFVRMRDPGMLMRVLVLGSQTVIGVGFLALYIVSPSFCHRFVGYVEEEACHTYTTIIETIENAPEGSEMAEWRTQHAPAIAKGYWHLGEDGTVLDMMYAVRADEAEHRDVNHVCSGIKEGQINPLYDPQEQFDKVLERYVREIMKKGSN